MSIKRSHIIPTSLLTITILSGAALSSTLVSATDNTDVVDEINITVPVSCTLSGTGMNTHDATINNGTVNSSIGETTMKIYCNDTGGFAIYAIGYTDDTDGKNVLTSSALGSTFDIATGTATSGNTSNWAMKLSTITSPTPTYPLTIQNSFDSFHTVPDDYTLVAKRTSGTDIGQSAEGSTLKSTYQVYVDSIQPAGTYTGQVKYTLVHPNDGAAPIKPVTIATAEYLQEVNSCPADLTEEQIYTLKDSRDEQEYKVAKLKDGKCWMVENLNIAGGTALSSTDTDFDANYTLPTTDGWTVTDGKLILPASATKHASDNDLNEYNHFSINNYAYVFNSGNKTNCGTNSQNTPCYSYYSWDTATLGSGRTITTTNTDASYSICPKNWKLPTSKITDEFNPLIAAESDFYNLATNYGMSTGVWRQDTSNFYAQAGPSTTANFLLSGYYYSGSFYDSGGRYWSSTSSSGNSAHYLFFKTDRIYLQNGATRRIGYPVRCILKAD